MSVQVPVYMHPHVHKDKTDGRGCYQLNFTILIFNSLSALTINSCCRLYITILIRCVLNIRL